VNLFERHATKTRPHEIWEALMLAALLLLPVDVGVRRLHITREQLEHARGWVELRTRRRSPTAAETETPASLAQLKGARARVRLGDSDIASLDVKAQTQEAASTAPAAESRSPERRESARARPDRDHAAAGESPLATVGDLKAEKPAIDAEPARPLSSRLLDARRKRRE
jgi:hypothetical protein